MVLLEKWRPYGVNVTFAQLIEKVTLHEWWTLIGEQTTRTEAEPAWHNVMVAKPADGLCEFTTGKALFYGATKSARHQRNQWF